MPSPTISGISQTTFALGQQTTFDVTGTNFTSAELVTIEDTEQPVDWSSAVSSFVDSTKFSVIATPTGTGTVGTNSIIRVKITNPGTPEPVAIRPVAIIYTGN